MGKLKLSEIPHEKLKNFMGAFLFFKQKKMLRAEKFSRFNDFLQFLWNC